jgi:hypothetical protein
MSKTIKKLIKDIININQFKFIKDGNLFKRGNKRHRY